MASLATMTMPYHPPPRAPLRILFQDEHLIAVDKPSGLLSVPGRGDDKQDCLLSRLCEQFASATVVHRLDMGTSGLMLFALDAEAQRELGRLFESRQVSKTYVARVRGVPNPAKGEINLPLIADWPRRPRQKVDLERGKPANTRFRVLDQAPDASSARVLLLPTTGRSHQLRVHLAALGHPILGDALYADKACVERAGRLMLHANGLKLPHPCGGSVLDLQSSPPF